MTTDKDTREEKEQMAKQVELDKNSPQDSDVKEKFLKSDTETVSSYEAENTKTLNTSEAEQSQKTTETTTEISQEIIPDGDNVSKGSEKDGKETQSNPSEVQKMEVDSSEKLISDQCEQPLSSSPISESSSLVTGSELKTQDIVDSNVTNIESKSPENMETCVANISTSTSKSDVDQESNISNISKIDSEMESKHGPGSKVHPICASETLKFTDPVLDSISDPLIVKDSNSDSIPVCEAPPVDPKSTLDSKSESLIVKDSNIGDSPPVGPRSSLDSQCNPVAGKNSDSEPKPKTDPSPVLDSKTSPTPDSKNDSIAVKNSITDPAPGTDPTAILNPKSDPRSPLYSKADQKPAPDTVGKIDPSPVTDSPIESMEAASEPVTDVDRDPEPVHGTSSERVQGAISEPVLKDIEGKSREEDAMELDPQPPTDTDPMTTKSDVSSIKEPVAEKPTKSDSGVEENEAPASVEKEDRKNQDEEEGVKKNIDEILKETPPSKEAESSEKGDEPQKSTKEIPVPNVQSEEKLPASNIQSQEELPALDVPSKGKLPVASEEILPVSNIQSEEKSPALDVPSKQKSPALNVPSKEKSPALDVASKEKSAALDVPLKEKSASLDVASEEKSPALDVASKEKSAALNVPLKEKSASLDVPSKEKLTGTSEEKLPAPVAQSKEKVLKKSPSLDVASEEKISVIDVPSEEKSRSPNVMSEEKLPALEVPSEDKLPALEVPSEDKLPALDVTSEEKLPVREVPSEDKLPALDVPSEKKSPVLDEEEMEVDEVEVSAFKSISESKGLEDTEKEPNIGQVETDLDAEDTRTKTVTEGEVRSDDIKTINNEDGKSVEHTGVTSPGSVDTSEDSQFSVEAPNSPSSVDLNTKVRDVVTRFKETAMDGEGDTSMDVPAFEDTPLGTPLSMLHSDTMDNPEDTNMSTFSNQTTEGPTPTKRPRLGNLASALEEFSKNIITVDKLYEYQWPQDGGEWHMLQEQVSEYLSIKSFKRKYPDMYRRFVDKEEKEFLMDRGVVTETLCDLGLTAVRSDEIFDLMYKDYPEKYQEFTEFMHGKQRQTIFEQHKEYDALNVEKSKMAEYMKKAMKSAAEFNQQIQRDRKEERKAFFDMQTFHVHYPEGRYKRLPANLTKPSAYPIALLPGQFQEHYTSYTSDELKYLPINTAMYDPPKLVEPVEKVASTESSEVEDSQEEKTASSDGDSDGSSDSGSNSDGETENKDKQIIQKADPVKETTCRRCEKKNKNKKRIRKVKEEIINCSECGAGGHPTCLELTAEMVGVIQTYPWQCMECKTCVECMDPYDEDKMMFCDRCDRGYHTFCVGVKAIPTGRWECKSCKVTTDTTVTPKSKRGGRH